MILSIVLISVACVFSIIGLVYLIQNREKYVIDTTGKIFISLYLCAETFFFIFLNLSFINMFPLWAVNIFWKVSIMLRIFKVGFLSSIHIYVLFKNYAKFLPAFIYSFLGGIIASYLIVGNWFDINMTQGQYLFTLNNNFFFFLLIFFYLSVIITTILGQMRGASNISFKKTTNLVNIILFHFSINSLIYLVFLTFPSTYLRFLFSLLFLSFLGVSVFITIKEFDLFVVVTNKIYDFVIFHRSGVLLFSYNFEENKEIDDSLLKGSILIGINHILSNFINKKSKLNIIKMKERDIIFEYDNKYGYAILVIVSHRNKIVEKAVNLFMKDFIEHNAQILEDINKQAQLIDVSEFKNSKKIIERYFKPYLTV
ncbi:MAG: hypothetical protein GF311_21160 [Candidatus Lokiarchaeota archaeon]|nr:hypothetical protein [Candidatus Lokiarchaeota archaeon]